MRRRSLDPAQIIFLGGWVEKLVGAGGKIAWQAYANEKV